MARTTRAQLEELTARLAALTGRTLVLDYWQPGDSRTPYALEDHAGRRVYGERRRSASELGDVLRFGLAVAGDIRRPARTA